jgi:3-phenylpropionate/trans-cinnamate dioxygenase ferredoxin reductase subunit
MPVLSLSDVVYTAGAPAMVERVARAASAVGARCYTDPFASQSSQARQRSLLARAADGLSREAPPLVPDLTRSMVPDLTHSMQHLYDQGAG